MNAVTKAVIETIGAAGFTVQLYGQDGQNVVEAVNETYSIKQSEGVRRRLGLPLL